MFVHAAAAAGDLVLDLCVRQATRAEGQAREEISSTVPRTQGERQAKIYIPIVRYASAISSDVSS